VAGLAQILTWSAQRAQRIANVRRGLHRDEIHDTDWGGLSGIFRERVNLVDGEIIKAIDSAAGPGDIEPVDFG